MTAARSWWMRDKSRMVRADIVDFYKFDLDEGAKDWQVAVVLGNDLIGHGEFWAFASQDAGYPYRVFLSIEEATAFLTSSPGETPPIRS